MMSFGAVQPERLPVGDDVLRRRPAREVAGEMDADQLGMEHFPRQPRHHLAAVRAADADREHAEAAAVGRVRVGADHEPAGEGVVLQHDLVDDAGARPPEADAELARGGAEEVVDLPVFLDGAREVVGGAGLGADQMVAVDRRRHGGALAAGHHELQERHLTRHVLQPDAVHAQAENRLPTLPLLRWPVPAVSGQDLLGQGERAAELPARLRETVGHRGVERADLLHGHRDPPQFVGKHANLRAESL